MDIKINNQEFILSSSGALYWVDKKMLLISDAHVGKISHFRKHGSALPTKAIFKNFDKLDKLIDYFVPEKICFLGDLFHSSLNKEWDLFASWVGKTDVPIVLIAGNHDVISPKKYEELNILIVSEWILDGFLLTHFPEEREGVFTFSGHLHPSVLLTGEGRQFLKLPCFFRSAKQMILPAFGEFTGTLVMELASGDIAYVIAKEEIIKIENGFE